MIRTLFPTLISVERPALPRGLTARLLQETYAFRQLDAAGRRWSSERYPNGYTSYSSICDLHERSPYFARLKRAIDRSAARFARRLEMELGSRELRMSSFWINIMRTHGHHSFHLHPLSAISGTFYLRVPGDAPGFRVEDPRIACFMGAPPRRARARDENRRYLELPCAAGQLLLFESWLKHEVPANRSREDRVSVSFNYDWIE